MILWNQAGQFFVFQLEESSETYVSIVQLYGCVLQSLIEIVYSCHILIMFAYPAI